MKALLHFSGDETHYAFLNKLLAGLLSGAISSAIANPTDLVKVRMQGAATTIVGKDKRTYRYKNFVDALYTIITTEGIWALYTGVAPTVARASVLAAVEMSMYETLKLALARFFQLELTSVLLHIIAALVASFFSSLASCPFDMARSRLMNQPKGVDGRGLLYDGPLDCMQKSVRKEGISVLWAGWLTAK